MDILLEEDCPTCDGKAVLDLSRNYLNYPVEGETDTILLYCNKCQDWSVKKKIKIGKTIMEFEYV